MLKKVIHFFLCYLPILAIQAFSGRITYFFLDSWYFTLKKAPWSPPSWVFPFAWSLLYFLMALSLWIIYESKGKPKKTAYLLFFSQLILNAIWPILFFAFHLPLLALIELFLLLATTIASTFQFYKINKTASYLLIPYITWILYAISLNGAILWLN